MSDDLSPAARLALLQRLTTECPRWAIWKGVERALDGEGDIDSLAPVDDWSAITDVFSDWALSNGHTAVTSCRHVPGVLLLMAISPTQSLLSELDVCSECYWRGSPLIEAERISSLTIDDRRGFKMMRPGAQGMFLLLLNGVQRGGRPDERAILGKDLVNLMRSDPDGVAAAASTLGLGRTSALDLVEASLRGTWNRRAAVLLEFRALCRSVFPPRHLTSRLRFRLGPFRTCPIVAATKQGRRTPRDIERWLAWVSRSHVVARAPEAR